MKKLLTAALALALAASLATTAFASSITPDGDATNDVTVTVGGENNVVYSVEIAWDSMDFTYNYGTGGGWDPTTHTYEEGTGKGWTGANTETAKETASADLTVTNHSNAAVSVSAKFSGQDTAISNGVTATLTGNVFDLGAGQIGEDNVDKVYNSALVTVSGAPTKVDEKFTVGTVTVTVNPKTT